MAQKQTWQQIQNVFYHLLEGAREIAQPQRRIRNNFSPDIRQHRRRIENLRCNREQALPSNQIGD